MTAADKTFTIFLWHYVKNLLFSFLDPLISVLLSVLHLSLPTHKQGNTSAENVSVNVVTHKETETLIMLLKVLHAVAPPAVSRLGGI